MPTPDDNTALPGYERTRLQTAAFKHVRETVATELKTFNLNITQWMMLGVLYHHPDGQKVSSIAQEIQVEVPLITTLAQPLLAVGYLEQHADSQDRRSKPLSLTEAGRYILPKIEARLSEVLNLLEAGISQDELDQYFQTLQTLIANARRIEQNKQS